MSLKVVKKVMLYSQQKESSRGVSTVYFTLSIWKATKTMYTALTLRSSAMSVTLHSDCLLCSQIGFSFLTVSSSLDRLQFL